ncbi:argininosuccinate lyase [Halogeometricum borinquense DSM 11551]|uniref:Argininosuccinate lyase n=1 Tax=Halogeometricum borinquense (strain ATCC 700274 / DSM 11551 / JCM 10706 / KCTC 4070 / PR3) TaxID=469382 RepID=E4NS97_HALBP|nr:argininosuccinate lyase [Halogeometricum borinquense]ADQ65782.1 argininosuccinate lyase [Halogeometricum borinquense DSM 11551]ELY26785.1 argininosuccinate lyase [Halogeometricum borinquense DSM 11551]
MNEEGGDEGVVRRDRFSGGPARGFMSSLAADERIFAADVAVDRAHVVMLEEQEIVESDVAAEILAALDDVESEGHAALPEGEDVHEAIETAVVEQVGPDGGKMHTARSRNDEVATCIRYRLREDLLDAIEATLALREALVDAAEAEVETVMPGYTHLQPAQPTTVAHYLLSYEAAFARDTARLLDAYDRTNQSPLGAAAFAGTPFDIDRERTAELLGFDGVLRNSMDASSARDFLLESVSALATHATTLSGLAEDLVIFSNKGFVELSDDYASTSSIMPQKVNPDTLELVRATAGDAASGLSGLLTTLKGLPRAYNRDLQRATPHAWDAVDSVSEATAVVAGAVSSASWPEETLESAAGDGFSTATGVADALAMAGLPFRTAHEVVAAAAERAEGTPDLATLDASAEEVLDASLFEYVSRADVQQTLDPTHSVESRDSTGGPAPAAVTAQLDEATVELNDHRTELNTRTDALESATEKLAAEVAVITRD